jgi:hypothetical protein
VDDFVVVRACFADGLVIPPDGPVGRITELTGINRFVAVYATLQLAAGAGALG